MLVCVNCGHRVSTSTVAIFDSCPRCAETPFMVQSKGVPLKETREQQCAAARKVLAEHGHRDATADDPGAIAQLTVALRNILELLND